MVINISVLTPDRVICSTTADEVILPGLTGQVGVFQGHATLITALDIGLLRIKLDGKWTPIILFGGLAEIDRDYVTVLVNSVEEINNIESNEFKTEIEKANLEVERLTLEIENAETSKARLDASEKLKRASALLQAKNYLL
uniref:CF1 epsilon subunit of ATP synthase n=1 Tax=Climaconeis sp. TaxID=2846830 RepID=A0A8F8X866_9STRA|nr:CF1 epsilon subunit of ATP synthase [Climaconeis sp.]